MTFELYEVLMENQDDRVVGLFFDEVLAKGFVSYFKKEYGCSLKIGIVSLDSEKLHILSDLLGGL